ncbi:DNA polymerase IV [Comamonadaceae bacterium M7527]|nr:DNA polymerase IV [Comamonadaceae bacterium M7527]
MAMLSTVPTLSTTHIRRIAHLDMDAFFASVELLRYPQLQGLPVVIGGGRDAEPKPLDDLPANKLPLSQFARLSSYTGRGVITTATYAARKFGIGSAMGLMKAATLCPDALLLPTDFERYRDYSRRFKKVIMDIAPIMENRGVDEVYIDLTDVPGGQREGGLVIARLIQKQIFLETGLTCSIGIAPNKLLAKMASELDKPNGITVLLEQDLQTRIWPLACKTMNGIGPKSNDKLKAHGLYTLGDIAACEQHWLIEQFGNSFGAWLFESAHGRDDRPVVTFSEPVSISRETTFERNLHPKRDRAHLGQVFTNLCERLAQDLTQKGYLARTVGIKLRDDQFQTTTRDISLYAPVADAKAIRQAAGNALKRAPLNRPLRLLGVKLSRLVKPSDVDTTPSHSTPDLFDNTEQP